MGFQNLKFPEGSTFLITGGAGFIGSNICEALIGMGYTVRCLDNLSTGHIENITPLMDNPRFTFLKEDIRDRTGWILSAMKRRGVLCRARLRCRCSMRRSTSAAH